MQDALGLSRGLHVQSMMYENNYELAVHAQCRLPDRLRAVVIPWPGVTDKELEILTACGVVGYRVTHRLEQEIDSRMVARVHEHGWGIHYLVKADDEWRKRILASPGRFVIEHMGGIDPSEGLESASFEFLQRCLDTGRCWVKLSPRPSKQETFPFDDLLPFVRGLVDRFPSRLLWGSDWPHPQYFRAMPNDVDLLDQMLDWIPSETIRSMIFVHNPMECFGFPPP
jgi:2-pyrone-4,6-dicarboxylate lactonase